MCVYLCSYIYIQRRREVCLFVCLFVFRLFIAAPVVYGGSQARGQIGGAAASLHHSHSHSHIRSELHLRPTPQLTAMRDP